jgi:hypothetical protein
MVLMRQKNGMQFEIRLKRVLALSFASKKPNVRSLIFLISGNLLPGVLTALTLSHQWGPREVSLSYGAAMYLLEQF